jgi:hypothetical protein
MCDRWPHHSVTAQCKRCLQPIYSQYGRTWFSCPLHMATCFRGQFPMGEDLHVRHTPLLAKGEKP